MSRSGSLRIHATIAEAETALDPITDLLEEIGADRKAAYKVRLALDELLVNVVSYAYDGKDGEVEIVYETSDEPRTISISIIDSGKPFNPLEVEEPELSDNIHERKIGGLGIFIVKNTMDEVAYRRENNQNIMTIKKKI